MSVYKKLAGSNDLSKLVLLPGIGEPIFVGVGIISSSGFDDIPDPNCNSILLCSVTRVINRRDVFINFNIYGATTLSVDRVGSCASVFTDSPNIVS